MNPNILSQLCQTYEIVLGSGSPRRVKLLSELDISFVQIIPETDETIFPDEKPHDFALRMSKQKAEALRKQLNDKQLAITCDTIVILKDKVLGKPEDETDAQQILQSLSGNQHIVSTSIALSTNQKVLVNEFESTTVYFNKVSTEQIKEYIATKEPMDKAGAYGIQGMGAFLVDRIDGNLDNVIGLPRTLLEKLATQILNQGN